VNFRKFADVTVEFPDGVVGVLGLNGVGKSSLFEAMAWALYGPVAARTSVDEVKRQGAAGGESCRVEFEFVFDEHAYRVVREMVGKHLTASASVTVDGRLAASGAEAVSRFVAGRLGMDCRSFYTSIFAKQKELNALSSMNPSERRPLILRMLGISVLDAVVSQIRGDEREAGKGIESLSYELVDEHGEKVMDLLLEQREALDVLKSTLEARIAAEKNTLQHAEETYRGIVALCQAAKTAYEQSQRRRETVEVQKLAFEKLRQLQDEENTLKRRVSDREHHQTAATEQLTNYKAIDQDLKDVDKRLKENLENDQDILRALEQKMTLLRRCQQDQREAEKKRTEIRHIGPDATCPTCNRELGAQYKTLLQHYSTIMTTADAQIVAYRKEAATVDQEHLRLGKQRQALEKKQHYLRSQRDTAESIKTTMRTIETELKRERQRLTAIIKETAALGVIIYNEHDYVAAVKHSKDAYDTYQHMLEQQNIARSFEEKRRLQLRSLEGEAKVHAAQEKSIRDQITRQEALQRQLQEKATQKQRLSMLGEVMAGFRTYLISQVRPTLSAYASELLGTLSEGKYTLLEFDEDYNLSMYDNGQAFGIERFSGGEEDLANLCTRLAISEIITERAGSTFNFVVLDEIFGSQDSGRRRNILSALDGFSSKFRQIFLVTHIEDIKNSVEHVISISEGENGISTVKIE
jgi:exonuclease SbcC